MRSLASGLGALLGIGGVLVFAGLGAIAALDGGGYMRLAFLVYGGAGLAAAVVGLVLVLTARARTSDA